MKSDKQVIKFLHNRGCEKIYSIIKLILVGIFLNGSSLFSQVNLYTYQSGNWHTASTWTTDPSGTTSVGSKIPENNDIIIILTSRTVNLTANVITTGNDITISNGGFLDQSTFQFSSTLAALRGEGTLKLASPNFPGATINTFVLTGGGTTEYYNSADFTFTQATYNNLTLNAIGITATQMSNITVNGNLHIKKGTFKINNDASTIKKNLTITGNVTVDNGASIIVGRGSTNTTTSPLDIGSTLTAPFIEYYEQFHRVVINGNFLNNGTVRFTNLDYPLYTSFPPLGSETTSGAASVYFQGASDNTLTCNGSTDFYNLIVDKGIDQTYKLNVYSTAYSNFRLFGANNSGGDGGGTNPNLKKALWIRTGTMVLRGLTIIPSLSEGTCAGGGSPNSDFYIPANGALILDGPEVVVLSTADDYREVNVAYGVSAPSNVSMGVTTGGCSSYSIYGKLQINDGYFSTRESGGFITWDVSSGEFIINGGVIDAKQFRAAGGAGGLSSFTQTGGLFILRGRFQRTPTQYTTINNLVDVSAATINTTRSTAGLEGIKGSFNINDANNVFSMSGGTIRIYDVCGNSATDPNYAFQVNSAISNINVTGGTVELLPTTGSATDRDFFISTTAPINNLTISRVSGTRIVQLNTPTPLTVLNNLSIEAGALTTNNNSITIGGNFNLATGTVYTPGSNTTTFNNSNTSTFTINGTVTTGFTDLIIDKGTGSLTMAGTASTTYNISNTFQLLSGTFNDGGKTLNIAGNVTNSGIHSGVGTIILNGTDPQIIGGDGNGIFGNLNLNNNDVLVNPVSLSASIRVNGTLTFSLDKVFDINTRRLILGLSSSIVRPATPTYSYISSVGDIGDGGVTKYFSSNSFTFPVGIYSTGITPNSRYTPTTISFSTTPNQYGYITVFPVDGEQMQTSASGKNRSLTYFWRVRSSGFNLGAATITQKFVYNQSDVTSGGGINENEYSPARFNLSTYTWNKGVKDDVDETNNAINWPNNVTYIDGDYTAGDDKNSAQDPFKDVLIYYSRTSGSWWNNSTWVTDTVTNANSGNRPDQNTPAIIRNGHTVTIDANDRRAGNLQIQATGVLDCGAFTGLNFGVVTSPARGSGKIRISGTIDGTAAFPAGDFSEFIGPNGGTVEYYTSSNIELTIPTTNSSYKNLILNPSNFGGFVRMPDQNMNIYGNMSVETGTGTARLNTANPSTLKINGNLNVNSGTLEFRDGSPQAIEVLGDVNVNTGATFHHDNNAGTTNTLTIEGNLINNGIFDMRRGSVCNVLFTGNTNTSISGTGSLTEFNNVNVNKGNSQITTLTLNVGGTLTTPTNNWLTLQNGTLRYMRINPSSDFTISEGTPFTIPATAGLYIDYANSESRNVLIANSNSNTNDLFLNGKLTLVQGNIYVGPVASPNNNNDIEYSGSGFSEIEILGGNLHVNGQIRRNPATNAGILSYNQSGGNVTINGQNAITSNAKLEILNDGSVFNMSGNSTLTIVRGGGGVTFGDLYLRPEFSNVTGGTIIFTQGTLDQAQIYRLDASVPLNNLTITGKNTATVRNALVNLMVNPLVLKGNLLLSNTQSILTSNNIDISLQGNFTNNGTYNYGTNLTTFSGNTQLIDGSSTTNFYDLKVNPVTSLTLIRNITVNNDLNLASGTMACGGNSVNLKRHFINNANYTNTGSGGVILNGNVLQRLSGTGTFGLLELNNPEGAKIDNAITLQNNLVMTSGIFDINQYLLTLGQNSILVPNGTAFSTNKMVTSEGVFSDVGIRKFFNTGAATFTYPIGIAGKYTPAELSITSNSSVGSIRVNTINERHPTVTDPNNVLKYYWEVESSGISGFAGNMVLSYNQSDVRGVLENQYVAARLIVPGVSWSKAAPGAGTDNVDESTNKITFTYPAGTNNLSGEYTAGTDAAIPNSVMTYTSNGSGNWNDKSKWSPEAPDGGPNGFIVVIRPGDVIKMNADNLFAYRTQLNGRLEAIKPDIGFNVVTVGHNLGTITGNGTLYLESGKLPAGRFTSFLDCSSGGTLEYGGTGSYTMEADRLDVIPNLRFTGTGTRILPNKDLTICNQLLIDGPTLDNSVNNRKLTILGSMGRSSGAFVSGTGVGATVSFAGSSAQTISNFSGTNCFNNLEINNAAGLSLSSSIDVSGNLMLTNGIISTTTANVLTITNAGTNCIIPAGGSSASFVNGPLVKKINQGDYFNFPIGKGSILGNNLTLSSTQTGTLLWTAEYFRPTPTPNSVVDPLKATNADEYWKVNVSSGNSAKVNLSWQPGTGLTPLMTQNGVSDMRIAQYNASSQWVEIGSTNFGDNFNGYSESTNRVTLTSGTGNFTHGSVSNMKARAKLDPTGPICGTAGIPVTFTTSSPINLNYTLTYTINEGAPQTVTVSSLPFTLPTLASGGNYKLTGFSYDNGTKTGVVDNGTVTVYAVPTTAYAGLDQTGAATCGATSTTLNGNNPAPYTGLWTIVSGTGGTIVSPSSNNSVFNGTNGSTYTLRWTISSGTCTSSDEMVVKFNLLPSQPALFTNSAASVCPGQTGVVYTVPNDPTVTYTWTYSGAGATINGTSNTVNLDFANNATSGYLSVTATNGCGTSTARSMGITVNPATAINSQSTATQTQCIDGSFSAISVTATGNGLTYQWYSNSVANTTTGTPIAGATFASYVPSASATGTTYYYCVVTGDCGSVTSSISGALIVEPKPTTGDLYRRPNN